MKSKKTLKKILSPCLAGGYYYVPELKYEHEGWSYILFTDLKYDNPIVNGREIIELKYVDPTNSFAKPNRWHKLNPHLLFSDYLYSAYIDCNITINSTYTFTRVQELYKKNTLIGSVKHTIRNCIYDEAEEFIAIGKDTKTNINSIIEFLKKDILLTIDYLKITYCLETILEKYLRNLMKDGGKYTRRNQLSMCYVLWKQNISYDFFKKREYLR